MADIDMADASAPYADQLLTESEIASKFPNRPQNSKETLPFHDLVNKLFEPLTANFAKKRGIGLRGAKDLKPHEIRRNIIDQFISTWRNDVGSDIFPAFRLILCDKDRDRSVYHLKEQKIGKLLVKVMMINKDSEDGFALLKWKQPGVGQKSAGDFAGRCYEIIKKRPMRTTPGNMTVADLNAQLDELATITAEDKQLEILRGFYYNMSAEELKWVIRILLRQMKIGATERTFFHAWHPDAEALFNVSSSLRRVCWELYDPDFRLEDETKGVTLMSCFQPQLAQFQKKSMETVVKTMGGAEFWIEEKLDGERMQMHFDNGEFKWWSRKAKEYTHLYGNSFDNGSVARFAKEAFDERVKSVILDGEMITWDPKLDCIVAFGTLKTAAIETSNKPQGNQHRPLFRVFDILYLNGTCLIDYPLRERRNALSSVIKNVHRRLEICQYIRATTSDEIEAELRKVVAAASEGLVVKNPSAPYLLNDRNDSWVKVKPEYMAEFGESLDLLVIGGYWGSGRRGNMLSSFLCGLRVDGNYKRPGDPPMKFWTFCKVGGGFTANEYASIAHQTEGCWYNWDTQKPPVGLFELAGGHREFEKPDQWIHPEKSFVVEVKAASVAESDQFKLGQTLRFPRFAKLRPDRNWTNSLSITGFLALKQEAVEEAKTKKMDVEVRRGGAGKRAKKEFRIAGDDSEAMFLPQIKDDAGRQVFEGLNFHVVTESTTLKPKRDNKTKGEMENLIKINGGKIFQNEKSAPNTYVIGDRPTVKVTAIQRRNTHNILTSAWIFDCIDQQDLLPLEPRHIFHAIDEATAQEAEHNIDEYGDSYARDFSLEDLQKLLESMSAPVAELSLDNDPELQSILEIEEALPGWIMKPYIVYIHSDTFNTKAAARYISYLGGEVSHELTPGRTTHVVVDSAVEAKQVREVLANAWKGPVPRVVDCNWAEECTKAGTVVDEERFAVSG